MKTLLSAIILTMWASAAVPISAPCTAAGMCECVDIRYESAEEAFKIVLEEYGAIFYGKVVHARVLGEGPSYREAEYTFEVIESWKGVRKKRFYVRADTHGYSCGTQFTIGSYYLLFGGKDKDRKDLGYASMCGIKHSSYGSIEESRAILRTLKRSKK